MAKYIYNNSGSTKTYHGVPITNNTYFQIQDSLLAEYQNEATLLADLANSVVKMSSTGSSALTGTASQQIDFLKGVDLTPNFAYPGGFKARFQGISGTATKNTTTNIDYKLTADRYINGVRLILEDHVFGDSITFQVIDIDNILGYGANAVLDEFGKDWYLDDTGKLQPDVIVEFTGKISTNLYIRLKYASIGTVLDVKVKANLRLYLKE